MHTAVVNGKSLEHFEYRFAPELWVVTAYYNPVGYKTRRANYEIFAQTLRRSGIPLLTVECAFGEQPFNLPEAVDVIRLRSDSMLWQKERLLNLAISWLPASCRYVAWLDCDLVFTNPNWAWEATLLLKNTPVVQLFETCNRLLQGNAQAEHADVCESFAKIAGRNTACLKSGRFEDHGHTGYAWAAQKGLLDDHGLYEYAIAGAADHYMAHAALGDFASICIDRMMQKDRLLIGHFQEWGRRFHESVKGNVGVVSGEVLHLWHGDLENRKYYLRHLELAELNFNPYTDLEAIPGRPLELRSNPAKKGLKEWFASYFASRHEDGMALTA